MAYDTRQSRGWWQTPRNDVAVVADAGGSVLGAQHGRVDGGARCQGKCPQH